MEAISADKNKMSMEGLLKLEEKISRMQHGERAHMLDATRLEALFFGASGLTRDRRDLQHRMGESNENNNARIRGQITKLDDVSAAEFWNKKTERFHIFLIKM